MSAPEPTTRTTYKPAHILFTSHHLLAPSKRRDLARLASQYRLLGFCKVGYPGIIYAEGDADDLDVFAREVKSWQWLALRLRVLEELSEDGERREEGAKVAWVLGRGDENGRSGNLVEQVTKRESLD